VVEDVVTTGGQIERSTRDLRDRGAVVTHAVSVIDREQGGAAALEAIDVELRALFLHSDLTRFDSTGEGGESRPSGPP